MDAQIGNSSSKSVALTDAFEFRFGESPFTNLEGNSAEFSGSEFLRGVLAFSKQATILPDAKISLIPCLPVLATSLVSAHLFQNLSTTREIFLHIDLPIVFNSRLEELAASFPTPVALIPKDAALAGEYRKRESLPAGTSNLSSPVFFCDPLDARRLWLHLFRTHCGSLSEIAVAFGSSEQTLQWQFRTIGAQHDYPWPQETLLENGLLPWLAGLLTATPELPGHAPLARLVRTITEHPSAWHIVIATPATLAGLASAIDVLAKPGDVDSSNFVNPLQLKRMENSEAALPANLVLARLSSRNSVEYSAEPGFIVRRLFESINSEVIPSDWKQVVGKASQGALERTKNRYQDWTKTEINANQERDFFRFAHRLAHEAHRLRASSFDLLLAAQSVVDSNFSYEFLSECRDYPESDSAKTLPEVYLPLSEIVPTVTTLSIERFETLQKRRFQGSKLKSIKRNQNKTPANSGTVDESKYADNSWIMGDHPYSCSFPEEDIFMEDFAFHYRDETRERIRAKEALTHELHSSLCDGIDLRSTLRNWYQEKIMVREEVSVGKADIGSIVFLFVERADEKSYPWVSYWLAEQHDKSDLMFFATPYADNVIGPGIAKSTFGGFAVIPIPNYLENPWAHPFIQYIARSPSDALLLAAAMATDNKSILCIAPEPPGKELVALLRRSGKAVIYVRLDELPPDKIRRLRTFHILAESGVRTYAEKYIRKDQT